MKPSGGRAPRYVLQTISAAGLLRALLNSRVSDADRRRDITLALREFDERAADSRKLHRHHPPVNPLD